MTRSKTVYNKHVALYNSALESFPGVLDRADGRLRNPRSRF